MDSLIILLVSFIPGALWLFYFYNRDKYEPEPLSLVIKAFIFGVIVVIPVGIIEAPFQTIIERPSSIYEFLLVTVVVVGFTEELGKFLAAKWAVFNKKEIDEVVDGVIYGISAGLGFSAAENFLYATTFGLKVGLTRAVVTCLVHASFSGIVGFFYGKAVVEPESGHATVLKGLLIASVLHGLYDFLVMAGFVSPFILFIIVGLLYLYLIRKIKYALTLSKFRP